MKSVFLPIPISGIERGGDPLKIPGKDIKGDMSDYADWTAVPAIATFESIVFGVGTLFLVLTLLSSSTVVPPHAVYGVVLATVQSATLAIMFVFIGMFARRGDVNRDLVEGYP